MAESGHGSFSGIDRQTFPMVVRDTELPYLIINGYAGFVFATE